MIRYGKALPAHCCDSEDSKNYPHSFIKLSFFNLFWIFVISSIIGLIIETIIGTIMDGYFKDRAGLLWGPFSPLYGLGGVALTAAVNFLKGQNLVIVFLVGAFTGGILEYCAGWFWESNFGIVAWDYSNVPLNFNGYTCVPMMIIWGIAGILWVKIGIPVMMFFIRHIPVRARRIATAIVGAFMIVDIVATLLAFNCWFERLEGLPVETPIQIFFDTYYGNDWMDNRFQTISVWTDIANR